MATAQAVRVGSSNYSGRKLLMMFNASPAGKKIFYGTSTTNLAKFGMPLAAGSGVTLPVTDSVTIYALSASGTGTCRLRVLELG